MRWALALALALVALATPGLAIAQPTPQSIWVMDLKVEEGLDAEVGTAMTRLVAATAAKVPGLKITTRADIESMLQAEEQRQLVGCDDIGCLAEIGGALGLDRMLTGSVSVVADTAVLSLELVNTKQAEVLNRVSVSWEGDRGQLTQLAEPYTRLLLQPDVAREARGEVEVICNVDDAEIIIDDTRLAEDERKLKLGLGKHRVRVNADGWLPHDALFVIERDGETEVLTVRLVEEARPWFKRWWVWTAAAVGVAAAVAVPVALSTTGDSGGNGAVPGETGININTGTGVLE